MKLPRHNTAGRSATAKKRVHEPPPPPEPVSELSGALEEREDALSLESIPPSEEPKRLVTERRAQTHEEVDDDDAETLRQQLAITGEHGPTSVTSVRPPSPISRPLPPPPPLPRTRTPSSGKARVAPLPPLPSSVPPPVTRSVRPPPAPPASTQHAPPPSLPKPSTQSAPLVLDLGEKDFAQPGTSASGARIETPQMMASTLPPRSSATEPPAPPGRSGGALSFLGIGALMLLVGAAGFALGTGYQSRAVVHVVASEMHRASQVEAEPEPAASTAPPAATTATAPPSLPKPFVPPIVAKVAAAPKAAPKAAPHEPAPGVAVAPAKAPGVEDPPYAPEPPPKTSAVAGPDDPTHGVTSAGF